MTREIPLQRDLVALVDDRDYERVSQYRWCARIKRNGRHDVITQRRGKPEVHLHRLIVQPPAHMFVDHINGDGLDNRRANLRVCTNTQNLWNRGPSSNSTTGLKGVCRLRTGWRARIVCEGQSFERWFRTAEEAARWHDRMARQLHGEFAWLNYPDEAA